MARRLRLRKDQADIDAVVKSWTADDEHLAGLPDPLGQSGPSDVLVKQWYRDFCHELAADREYWQSRTPPDTRPIEELISSEDIDLDIYHQIMRDNAMRDTTAGLGFSPNDQRGTISRASILGRAPRAFRKHRRSKHNA